MKWLICFACLGFGCAFANSVHLKNDSGYQLRAVVRGQDGSYLGEMIVMPQQTSTWSDNSYGAVPFDEWGPVDHTTTPYTVLWYCMSGTPYSVNKLVPVGALVTAQFGEGTRECKGKQEGVHSPQQGPSQGYLNEQNEPEALQE
jgi:hypothetical protein